MTVNGGRHMRGRMQERFRLQFPQSLGEFTHYEDAQAAVDFLSDKGFPVQNLLIVGTDLRLVERVVGRRTWGRVLGQGALSGITTGMILGLLLMLVFGGDNPLPLLTMGLALGIVMGVLTAGLGYSLTQGKRDFDSMSQTVAGKYEVLVEHNMLEQAKDTLAEMPGYRARHFD